MKIRRLLQFSSATVLSIASLLTFGSPVVHASPLYTCTWTGGGTDSNFSTAANWSGCNGSSPQPGDGDNLVFSTNTLSANATLNNDITNLTVGSITFQGSGSSVYTIGGNSVSIAGGIVDNSGQQNKIGLGFNLTANQTFSNITIESSTPGVIDLAGNNLTLDLTNINTDSLTGSGTLEASDYAALNQPSPNFAGQTVVDNGAQLAADVDNGDSLGTSSVTVASGGTLEIFGSNDTATLPNNITFAGTGVGGFGAISSCLSDGQICEDDGNNSTLTLTGNLVLTGDAQLANGNYYPNQSSAPANTAIFTLNGSLTTNGYNLTFPANSNTLINGSALSAQVTSSPDAPVSSVTKAPKAPDTGLATISAHPLASVLAGSIAAGLLVMTARRLQPVRVKAKK